MPDTAACPFRTRKEHNGSEAEAQLLSEKNLLHLSGTTWRFFVAQGAPQNDNGKGTSACHTE
jgi:hypothetical protein